MYSISESEEKEIFKIHMRALDVHKFWHKLLEISVSEAYLYVVG